MYLNNPEYLSYFCTLHMYLNNPEYLPYLFTLHMYLRTLKYIIRHYYLSLSLENRSVLKFGTCCLKIHELYLR